MMPLCQLEKKQGKQKGIGSTHTHFKQHAVDSDSLTIPSLDNKLMLEQLIGQKAADNNYEKLCARYQAVKAKSDIAGVGKIVKEIVKGFTMNISGLRRLNVMVPHRRN